jgi:hypothetical protein
VEVVSAKLCSLLVFTDPLPHEAASLLIYLACEAFDKPSSCPVIPILVSPAQRNDSNDLNPTSTMPIPTRSLSLRGQSKQVSVANQNQPPVQPATQSVQTKPLSLGFSFIFIPTHLCGYWLEYLTHYHKVHRRTPSNDQNDRWRRRWIRRHERKHKHKHSRS